MKALFYGAVSSIVVGSLFFMGSVSAMAQVIPPAPLTLPTPRVSTIVGTITAIDTQTGEESITVLPNPTSKHPDQSAITIPIDSATRIEMIGSPNATVSNLAVVYNVLVTKQRTITSSEGVDAVPASTSISINPKDKPVEHF
jgi:hypothetical protein